ncbi:GNAT family N-acetyltransferase [uncultured Sulfitobacter sp.]|uniref:GNAT family N-acetyltransferase n=1 Tax=uncultured Sulfitobacter sp. TaxID=191468 RepID=UPI002614FBF8|nr:GNAT family N-acetyltransferase [uncultured Sulfitobacter sp.]
MAHITVAAHQIAFSGIVAEAFKTVEASIDFHAIFDADHAIGFFRIDRGGYSKAYPCASKSSLGLRAFIIDRALQGCGYASGAIALLRGYLPLHYNADAVFLTVNMSNPAAVKCYLNGGFADTGEVWPHGMAGPQYIMRLSLAS